MFPPSSPVAQLNLRMFEVCLTFPPYPDLLMSVQGLTFDSCVKLDFSPNGHSTPRSASLYTFDDISDEGNGYFSPEPDIFYEVNFTPYNPVYSRSRFLSFDIG